MLAVRRAASSLRSRSYHVGAARICSAKLGVPDLDLENDPIQRKQCCFASGCGSVPARMPLLGLSFWTSLSGCRNLSSQAGAKSGGETDLEDGFSELEEPHETNKVGEGAKEEADTHLLSEAEEGLETEVEGGDVEASESDLLEHEMDEKPVSKQSTSSSLLKALLDASHNSVGKVLDMCVEKGNSLSRSEIAIAMSGLRNRRLFGKALQLSVWLHTNNHLEFVERDYTSHLDLTAKVQGLYKAEQYIGKIPESFRGEVAYRTLLANCVAVGNLKKAEAVFNKMRDLGLPLTSFACNQLLLLYKRLDRKKIADVLLMMENENIKPTNFTYKLLIDIKGRANDIEGMEQIVETMKSESIEPDMYVQAMVARHYIYGGCIEKAEAVLKEMEGCYIKENHGVCKFLLPLYASLGKEGEVRRLWDICKVNPSIDQCLAAIEAWGNLGCIEDAEAVFELMTKTWKKLSARYYNALLKVYSNHKLLSKGKDLVKRMSSDGCIIGPTTWDALVKLYVGAGELEKADSLLQKAVNSNRKKPMYTSYLTLLENYAKRGDVHNAEKIFNKLRISGYYGRMKMYQVLLEAYIVAKTPAYGFRERMKADNIFPNNIVLGHLKTVDDFTKNDIADLLE